MEKTILIKKGQLVLEEQTKKCDLLIKGENISLIQENISGNFDEVLDAEGKIIFAGGIDPHTHFHLPAGDFYSSDDFSSGSKAALWGGTTTIIDFANQMKTHSLKEAFDLWESFSKGQTYCDYGFHLSVTDVTKKTLEEVEFFFKEGITSFKTFLAYPHLKISLDHLEKLMQLISKLGGLVTLHAECGEMIEEETKKNLEKNFLSPVAHRESHPDKAEILAILDFLNLAQKTSALSYVVHLSTHDGRKLLEEREHLPFYFETCPQYLLLDEESYKKDFESSSKFVMSPPLRGKENLEELWNDLLQGKIQTLATDHCPFLLKEKSRGKNNFTKIPNGAPGVEDRVEIFYDQAVVKRKMPLHEFSKIISTNAAKLFGLYPKKGTIKIGSDADLIIFNPNATWKRSAQSHHMNCDYNLYEGLEGQGVCESVLLRGKWAIFNRKFVMEKPIGQYQKRKAPMRLPKS